MGKLQHVKKFKNISLLSLIYVDFGQNKIIVMALLCGCDYCPEGVDGVGRDSVLKLLKKYKDDEILSR